MKHIYLSQEQLVNKKKLNSSKPLFDITNESLPDSCDLRSKVPSIYDQGQIGSCTANAFCNAFRMCNKDKLFEPSRLFIYYCERYLEDGQKSQDIQDSGADVTDAVSTLSKFGICDEKTYPYETDLVNNKPTQSIFNEASKHKYKLSSYQIPVDGTQNSLNMVKSALVSGLPVMTAIQVYDSFEQTDSTGVVSIPDFQDENNLGGHEVLCVGYNNQNQFIFANSWSTSWGDNGFFYLPSEYLLDNNLTSQFEIIKTFEL